MHVCAVARTATVPADIWSLCGVFRRFSGEAVRNWGCV